MIPDSGERFKAGDTVHIKKLYVPPIMTAHEVRLLLEYLEDFSPMKIAFAMIIFTGCRPIEVGRIKTTALSWNAEMKKFLTLRHLVYKAQGRVLVNQSKSFTFKEVLKDLNSEWLSRQLEGYLKRAPKCQDHYLFTFRDPDNLSQVFTQLRKKVKYDLNEERHGRPRRYTSKEYDCFLDTNMVTVMGQHITKYRCHAYALRRFYCTWAYYMVFKQDMVAVSKYIGHSNAATTSSHYVYPAKSIGLTDQMIREGIKLDDFLFLEGKKQMHLHTFDPDIYANLQRESDYKSFRAEEQRTLWEFEQVETIKVAEKITRRKK